MNDSQNLDHQITAQNGAKRIVDQILLPMLLAIATEKDEDQEASIRALMKAVSEHAKSAITKVDQASNVPMVYSEMLSNECESYIERITNAALGIAKN